MIFIAAAVSEAMFAYELEKLKRERLLALDDKQFDREMRMRELNVSERIARAAEKRNTRRGFFVGRTN